MEFERINVTQAKDLLDDSAVVVDIRDELSYRQGHIDGAIHLDNNNVQDFMETADRESPLIVCCYHGNMSQGSAAYFSSMGFARAYSLDGGYEAWAQEFSGDS